VSKINLFTLVLCIVYFTQLGVGGFFEGAQARYEIWDQSLTAQKVLPIQGIEAGTIKPPIGFSHSHNFMLDIFYSENFVYRYLALLLIFFLLFFLLQSWRRGLNIAIGTILFLLIFSSFDMGLRFDTFTMPISYLFISLLLFKYPFFSIFHSPVSIFNNSRNH
jgi:hypothetical protein